MNIFKPGDFMHRIHDERTCEKIAHIANEKLNTLIEAAPVVYGFVGDSSFWSSDKSTFIKENITHKARLICIEELEKDLCKHEPYHSNANVILASNPPQIPKPIYKCSKCHIELQATWSEVK